MSNKYKHNNVEPHIAFVSEETKRRFLDSQKLMFLEIERDLQINNRIKKIKEEYDKKKNEAVQKYIEKELQKIIQLEEDFS